MTADTSPPSASLAKRRFLPRFSLRVLLLAVTAFAIGFPIWYRWPYEEEVIQKTSGDLLSPPGEFRTITTWQRQWGGGRKRHGTYQSFRNGVLSSVGTWRDDQFHGPYRSYFIGTKTVAEEGNYVDGEMDGVWKSYNDHDGSLRSSTTWLRGKRVGPATMGAFRGNQVHALVLNEHIVVELDGQPIDDRLGKLLAEGKIEPPHIVKVLKSPSGGVSSGLPITTVTENLWRNHQVPVFVDHRHVDPNLPVTCNALDIPLSAALTVMMHEKNLACDVRYGCIWITSPSDTKNWHDPTGVAEIFPPADSLLATAWKEPVTVLASQLPLDQVLQSIAQPIEIAVDDSRIKSSGQGDTRFAVTLSVQGIPFKDALGLLLYQTRCRCKLEGETLVILPPEKE
jgi:hypothetical protein